MFSKPDKQGGLLLTNIAWSKALNNLEEPFIPILHIYFQTVPNSSS